MSGLSPAVLRTFAEYLTHETSETSRYVNWQFQRLNEPSGNRCWADVSTTSRTSGKELTLDSNVQVLPSTAYLRPLINVVREMGLVEGVPTFPNPCELSRDIIRSAIRFHETSGHARESSWPYSPLTRLCTAQLEKRRNGNGSQDVSVLGFQLQPNLYDLM